MRRARAVEREHAVDRGDVNVLRCDRWSRGHQALPPVAHLVGMYELSDDRAGVETNFWSSLRGDDPCAGEDELVINGAAEPLDAVFCSPDPSVIRQPPQHVAALRVHSQREL